MIIPPDPDVEAVYNAEDVAFGGTVFNEILPWDTLLDLAEEMFHTGWWDRLKVPVPDVKPAHWWEKSSSAKTYLNWKRPPVIRLKKYHVCPRVLAHEAAHIAQDYFYPYDRVPNLESHGREFRAFYLNTTRIFLGPNAVDELQVNFERRLPVRPEHQPGKPGWILTAPGIKPEDVAENPDGIFTRWWNEQNAIARADVVRRHAVYDAAMVAS